MITEYEAIKAEPLDATYEYSFAQRIENEYKAEIIMGQKLKNKTARQIFEMVQNNENWKLPTNPVMARSLKTAKKIAQAIMGFTGGAEIDNAPCDNCFVVTSKGYYHYIGA